MGLRELDFPYSLTKIVFTSFGESKTKKSATHLSLLCLLKCSYMLVKLFPGNTLIYLIYAVGLSHFTLTEHANPILLGK